MKEVFRDCDQTRVDLRRSVLESAGIRCFVRNAATHNAIVGGLMVAFFPYPISSPPSASSMTRSMRKRWKSCAANRRKGNPRANHRSDRALVPKLQLGNAGVPEAPASFTGEPSHIRTAPVAVEAELRRQVRSQAGAWERGQNRAGFSADGGLRKRASRRQACTPHWAREQPARGFHGFHRRRSRQCAR